MAEQALSDVKILDLTWYISGPYCTKLFADYGADVIKVERPGEGDPARKMGPFFKDDPHPEKSGLFLYLNTNKRGITLNLKSQWGNRIIRELVRDVDILVEGFRPGVMEKLGLDYEVLEKVNPKLVMASISNFGQTGPYRDFEASEIVIYGMGGSMNTVGLPGREPTKKGTGTPVLFSGGNAAAMITMIALYAARIQGVGQHVDVSLFEAQMGTIDRRMSHLIAYQYNNETAPRADPRATRLFPFGIQPAGDGHWEIAAIGSQWPAVSKMMDMPELLEKWPNIIAQMAPGAKEEFDAVFIPWCFEHTKAELVELGQKAGALCGPLATTEELLRDPHFRERGFWVEIDHPVVRKVTYPGAPFKCEEMPWRIRRPAPLLGQHNEEIYCEELGYTKQELVKLKEAGAI
jgi:crotonobetainyl-CoA:carnitine CoA-transferase CaiB-like acyl-CoA transferase